MALETLINDPSASRLGSNVIPTRRKVTAEAGGALELDLYDPGSVPLNRVTGGFNTAVQIAAMYCLRSYAKQIDEVSVVARRTGSRLAPELAALQGELADPWWATLVLEPGALYGIGFDLTPTRLAFSDGHRVTITLQGRISFMTRALVGPPAPPRPQVPARPGPMPAPTPLPPPSTGSGPTAGRSRDIAATGDRAAPARDVPEVETPMQVLHTIGNLEVTLSAPYQSTVHAQQRSADVWMNLDDAEIAVTPQAGDARLVYDAFLASKARNLAAQLAPVAQMPLTPTISLAGRNPANSRIDEFAQFDVRVFHVVEHERQALCVAFDVVPSCRGIIEDVRHFIGGCDYGVVHDEYVVERIIRHKWNEGGFDRSITLTGNVSMRVKRDGHDRTEDALVVGRLVLGTLDVVALVPHADLRTDVLSLGGEAQAIPDRIVLGDGTIVTPDKVDLGPPQDTRWAVNLLPALTAPPEPDPEMRDFQVQAYRDGIRHLARPFSRFPIGAGYPEVQYTRTEAVQKRIFYLGQMPVVFT